MPDLKLVRIEDGDSQKVFIDKINQNFSSILSFGGGPYGKLGPQGPQGSKGETGPIGSFGDPGSRGNVWTVGPTQPSGSLSLLGDFWLNTSNFNLIYQFDGNNWGSSGRNLISRDLFRTFGPLVSSTTVSNKFGYFLTPVNPENYTIVLNDSPFTSGSSNISYNPQYSKLVISVNNTASPSKNLLEFGKSTNQASSALHSKNPRFLFQTPGSTAGQYGLTLSAIDGMKIDLLNSNLNLTSRTSFVKFRSSGLNINLNSALPFSASTSSGNISMNLGGTAFFSNTNFQFLNNFYIPLVSVFDQQGSTGSSSPLLVETTSSTASNVRHKSFVEPTQESFLFRTTDLTVETATETTFAVFGNGDVLLNRRINSFESPKTVTLASTSNVFIAPAVTVAVYWVNILPSIALASSASSSSAVLNNGIDVVIDPNFYGPSQNIGISLWTPSAFTYSVPPTNSLGGWLSLLNPGECLNVRVRMANDNRYFRFLGLSTGSQTSTPTGTYLSYAGNGQFVDLSGDVSSGATQVEFTIMNISNSSNSSTSRWFKVYYSAWGGNLGSYSTWDDTTKCGILYTYNSTPF